MGKTHARIAPAGITLDAGALARFLRCVEVKIVPLDEELARACGELCGATNTSDARRPPALGSGVPHHPYLNLDVERVSRPAMPPFLAALAAMPVAASGICIFASKREREKRPSPEDRGAKWTVQGPRAGT